VRITELLAYCWPKYRRINPRWRSIKNLYSIQ